MKPGQCYMFANGDYITLSNLYKAGRRWVWECDAVLTTPQGRCAGTERYYAAILIRMVQGGTIKLSEE